MYCISNENVNSFIYEWNIRFPLDRWWRQKHKVAFNSPEHRESCFIDQLIEYREDKFYNSLYAENLGGDEEKVEPYKKGAGNWLLKRESKLSEKEIDDLFDSYKL